MSRISFYLRNANSKGLSPVTVRFSHKGSNFPKASGESVIEQYFNQSKGIATEKHPDCSKINAGIRRVVSLMEQAREACKQNKVEPVREHMEYYYDLLVKAAEVKAESDIVRDTIGIPLVMLPDLRRRLLKAQEEVSQLQGLIRQLDPDDLGDTVGYWFDQWIEERQDLEESSITIIKQARNRVVKFNPAWQMQEVNNEKLKELEQWMLAKKYSTNTIILTFERLKAVCYHYGKKLKLDVEEIRQHRRVTKSVKANRNGMVRLSKKQINQLLELELKGKQAKSRDQFVFLCLTGLRYCDSLMITPDSIRPRTNEDGEETADKELFLVMKKVKHELVIPLSEKTHNILIRNNFDFIRKKIDKETGEVVDVKDKRTSNFNAAIRIICRQIPSLHAPVNILQQKGGKTIPTRMPKHQAVKSHTGRKSMVNNALELGINPVAVAGIVGHANTNLIMSTYGDPSVGIDRITEM